MTIMDESYGWKDEDKPVGSKFAACMWIYTKEVLTRGQIPTPEMEEYFKRRMMSIMLSMTWVCAGALMITSGCQKAQLHQHVEEVMGTELDYKIGIPCVVQWCMSWLSPPTRLNRTLENQGIKIAKYHEAVNMAIAHAISRPCGGAHTPRSCMLTTVAGFVYKTPLRSWDMNKELGGWE